MSASTWGRTWGHAWERATLYLPVAPAHEPDYFMRDFSVKSFDANGRLQSEVRGRLAQHFPDTDTLEIEQADIRSTDAQGRVMTATARRAITNADGSEVQLLGDAVVQRVTPATAGQSTPPVLRLQGQHLRAWVNSERVQSDQPVVLTQGNDSVTADTLDYDNKAGLVTMTGNVRGVVQPARSRR